jgi:hypothetical protein
MTHQQQVIRYIGADPFREPCKVEMGIRVGKGIVAFHLIDERIDPLRGCRVGRMDGGGVRAGGN